MANTKSVIPTQQTNGALAGLYDAVRDDAEVREYLTLADEHMGSIGFTEHGFRHGAKVAKWAGEIMTALKRSEEEIELARIAGLLHDIGNFICREDHGQTGANLLYQILKRHPFTTRQLGLVLSAVGNHEEQYGQVFNSICAAVMLADKSDVHRSRVRSYDPSRGDMHDNVNYAVTESKLLVDAGLREIKLELKIDDTIASVMDYFQIFLSRMVMCRNAAAFLGCEFHISCNGRSIS